MDIRTKYANVPAQASTAIYELFQCMFELAATVEAQAARIDDIASAVCDNIDWDDRINEAMAGKSFSITFRS